MEPVFMCAVVDESLAYPRAVRVFSFSRKFAIKFHNFKSNHHGDDESAGDVVRRFIVISSSSKRWWSIASVPVWVCRKQVAEVLGTK